MVGYPSLSLPEPTDAGGDCHGVWRSLVARFVRDEEAAGSNPVTPTTQSRKSKALHRKTRGGPSSCVAQPRRNELKSRRHE